MNGEATSGKVSHKGGSKRARKTKLDLEDSPPTSPAKKNRKQNKQESADINSNQPSTSSVPRSEGSILQLKITLRYITPPIWRRIQVLNSDTFHDLHLYIQEAMGWGSCHAYQFTAQSSTNVGEEVEIVPSTMHEKSDLCDTEVKLSEYLTAVDDFVLYEYDFGDGWEHDVFVEKILPLSASTRGNYPKCVGGKRACPPDDCGGSSGYEHLLEVLKNPSHEEYEELITEWLDRLHPGFDPEKFSRKRIFKGNRILVKL